MAADFPTSRLTMTGERQEKALLPWIGFDGSQVPAVTESPIEKESPIGSKHEGFDPVNWLIRSLKSESLGSIALNLDAC